MDTENKGLAVFAIRGQVRHTSAHSASVTIMNSVKLVSDRSYVP
jgi:hypothetical protein